MSDDVISSGDGPVRVVALHGIQGTRAAWQPVSEALGDTCTFVLPNLPGRGRAPRPASAAACTLAAYAEVLRRTIDAHAGSDPFILAGWSMGVSVSLAYLDMARRDPAMRLPAGLVLVSGTPQVNAVQWFRATAPDALVDEIATRECRLGLREAADHRTVAWTWQSIRHTDQRHVLPAIGCPTLVIHGSADDDCPLDHAATMARDIPDATLTVLQGAGHSVLTQDTDEVAAAFRVHLGRLTPAVPPTEMH